MKKMRFITFFLVLFTGVNSAVIAGAIDERLEMAYRRIDHGIQSGALTHHEARRLRMEFDRVRDDEARGRADGRFDHRERERLNAELDRLENHISYLKHNDNYRDHNRYRDSDRGNRPGYRRDY